ncbi:MAG: GNAT family N-acetyltransferase [Sporichthyaceae bacterium]
MHIEQLDPADEARIAGVLALWAAAQAVDRPHDPAFSAAAEGGRIRHPLPDEPTTYHLAYDGARLVGVADIELPHLDNTGTGWTQIQVHPDARGAGVGTTLADYVTARLREADRKLAVFECPMDSPSEAFARGRGAELGILSARRRLVIDDGVRALAGELAAASRPYADGYEVHTVVGRTPERWIDGMAYLHGRMSTDAPLDDLEWEPESYDANRLREREARLEPWGLVQYTALAVHTASGDVAGFTTIGMSREVQDAGYQHNTIVDPDHRGHRLGTLLKVENLRNTLAHEPALARLFTWNAVSNGPMIAVNEAMGFRLFDHWGEWQIRL